MQDGSDSTVRTVTPRMKRNSASLQSLEAAGHAAALADGLVGGGNSSSTAGGGGRTSSRTGASTRSGANSARMKREGLHLAGGGGSGVSGRATATAAAVSAPTTASVAATGGSPASPASTMLGVMMGGGGGGSPGGGGMVGGGQKKQKPPGLRRGKWTPEEEKYANRLIQEFKEGVLPLTDGTTLRTFLSIMLNCDPMRISKKFVGSNCIGKQVFRRRQGLHDEAPYSDDAINTSREELADLERNFLERVAETTSKLKHGGGGAGSSGFGRSHGSEHSGVESTATRASGVATAEQQGAKVGSWKRGLEDTKPFSNGSVSGQSSDGQEEERQPLVTPTPSKRQRNLRIRTRPPQEEQRQQQQQPRPELQERQLQQQQQEIRKGGASPSTSKATGQANRTAKRATASGKLGKGVSSANSAASTATVQEQSTDGTEQRYGSHKGEVPAGADKHVPSPHVRSPSASSTSTPDSPSVKASAAGGKPPSSAGSNVRGRKRKNATRKGKDLAAVGSGKEKGGKGGAGLREGARTQAKDQGQTDQPIEQQQQQQQHLSRQQQLQLQQQFQMQQLQQQVRMQLQQQNQQEQQQHQQQHHHQAHQQEHQQQHQQQQHQLAPGMGVVAFGFDDDGGPVPRASMLNSLPSNSSMTGSVSVQDLAMLLGMSGGAAGGESGGLPGTHQFQAPTGVGGGSVGADLGGVGGGMRSNPSSTFLRSSFDQLADLQSDTSHLHQQQQQQPQQQHVHPSTTSALSSHTAGGMVSAHTGTTGSSGTISGSNGSAMQVVAPFFMGARRTSAEDFLSLLQDSEELQARESMPVLQEEPEDRSRTPSPAPSPSQSSNAHLPPPPPRIMSALSSVVSPQSAELSAAAAASSPPTAPTGFWVSSGEQASPKEEQGDRNEREVFSAVNGSRKGEKGSLGGGGVSATPTVGGVSSPRNGLENGHDESFTLRGNGTHLTAGEIGATSGNISEISSAIVKGDDDDDDGGVDMYLIGESAADPGHDEEDQGGVTSAGVSNGVHEERVEGLGGIQDEEADRSRRHSQGLLS